MRRVAIIVVNYRTVADTIECLESALRLHVPEGTSTRIVIIDNGSEDSSWVALLAWATRKNVYWHARHSQSQLPSGLEQVISFRFSRSGPEVSFLSVNENRGYAAGCNYGIQFALQDPFTTDCWVLNSDILFRPDSLVHLLNASHENSPAIYGSTLLYPDDLASIQAAGGAFYLPAVGRSRHFGKGRTIDGFRDRIRRFDYIVGAAMFFPREVVEAIGLLPEQYFLYFEETEWCARARHHGIDLVWVRQAQLIHKEGKSTGAEGRFRKLSDVSFHYVVRNSLLFSEFHYPLCLPSVFLYNACESIRYWFAGDRRKLSVFREAVRDYWKVRLSVSSFS